MAIDPPYRLDPLQNVVNVKWSAVAEGVHGWRPISDQHLYDLGGRDTGIPFLITHPDFAFPNGPPEGFTLVHFDEFDWIFIE